MTRQLLGSAIFILASMQLVLVLAAVPGLTVGNENFWLAFVHSFTASSLFVVSVWLFCVDAELLGENSKPVYIKKS